MSGRHKLALLMLTLQRPRAGFGVILKAETPTPDPLIGLKGKRAPFLMIPSSRFLSFACLLFLVAGVFGQDNAAASKPAGTTSDKAASYYNYSLGHLYAELAGGSGSRELFTKAVEAYRAALK